MLLILTNSQDVTADYLAAVLRGRGVPFLRLDTDTLLERITFHSASTGPIIRAGAEWYAPGQFTNVWYRRPERLAHRAIDSSPEGKFALEEWAEALEGFFAHIPDNNWVNHPAQNVRASHKLEQLSRAAALGLVVPDTLVTQDPAELRGFHARHGGDIICKPMASGCVERPGDAPDSLVYTNRVTSSDLSDLDELRVCPTLFQRFIQKECDVRITLIDEHVHAVGLTARDAGGGQRCDIRRNNMDDVIYRPISPPAEVRSRLLALTASYSLRFAAIDMAVTPGGEWVFFEVNPNGQWAWLDLLGATDIASSFVETFAN
jgi:hypothetical protein